MLRVTTRDLASMGQFYLIDANVQGVVQTNLDLEDYAREIGVLKPHEKLD